MTDNAPKRLFRVVDKYIGLKFYTEKPINADYVEYKKVCEKKMKSFKKKDFVDENNEVFPDWVLN